MDYSTLESGEMNTSIALHILYLHATWFGFLIRVQILLADCRISEVLQLSFRDIFNCCYSYLKVKCLKEEVFPING